MASWRTKGEADRTAIGDSLVAVSGGSFTDFRVAANSSLAVLGASVYFSNTGKTFITGRSYTPRSAGGQGWASVGSDFKYLNSPLSIDPNGSYANLAFGLSSLGNVFAVFLGQAGSAQPGALHSAVYHPGAEWEQGSTFSNSLNGLYGQYPLYGYTTAAAAFTASDSTVYGYFGYIDGATKLPQVRLAEDGLWDPSGSVLPNVAGQIDLLEDGIGVTALWTGGLLRGESIAAGYDHGCTLVSGNKIFCWGENDSGQLGNNSTTESKLPVQVTNLDASAADKKAYTVSSGDRYSCAIVGNDRHVACWGANESGQLGNGQSGAGIHSVVPVSTCSAGNCSAAFSSVTQISTGPSHSCAVISDGYGYCWGKNDSGQAGVLKTSTTVVLTPNAVKDAAGFIPSNLDNVISIAAGGSHSCAVKSTGTLFCWGKNNFGQTGTGADTHVATAVIDSNGSVLSKVADAVSVIAGESHTCMLSTSGAVFCWGKNDVGQMGTISYYGGNNLQDFRYSANPTISSGAQKIVAGNNHTCALMNGGEVLCWGDNSYGQLGFGAVGGYQTFPVRVAGLTGKVIDLSAGQQHTCAILENHLMTCWGTDGFSGTFGNGANNEYQATAGRAFVSCVTPIMDPDPETADNQCTMALMSEWAADPTLGFTVSARNLTSDVVSRKGTQANVSPVYGFSAAADSLGNVVSVFLQSAGSPSTDCSLYSEHCDIRVFGAARGVQATWNGPSQLDGEAASLIKTTYYQASDQNGLPFVVPTVAYLGDGQFLAAFALMEDTDTTTRTSRIYSKLYNVGSGWDSNTVLVDEKTITVTSGTDPFHQVQSLKVVTDRAGHAMLLVRSFYPDEEDSFVAPDQRDIAVKTFFYQDGAWGAGEWISDSWCRASVLGCRKNKVDGALFSATEGFAVFPASVSTDDLTVRLYSAEYR